MAFKIISQPGVMMRRDVLQKSGYLDVNFHYMLDHHLWLRMTRLAPLVYMPRVQARARFHADAKNLAHAPGFGTEALQVASWLDQQAEFAPYFNRRKVWGGAYRVNGWYLVEGGQPGPALRSYFHSMVNDPMAASADWRRILFAVLSMCGLAGLKSTYYRLRQKVRRRIQPEIYTRDH